MDGSVYDRQLKIGIERRIGYRLPLHNFRIIPKGTRDIDLNQDRSKSPSKEAAAIVERWNAQLAERRMASPVKAFIADWCEVDPTEVTAIHVDPQTGLKGRIDLNNGTVEARRRECDGRANGYIRLRWRIRRPYPTTPRTRRHRRSHCPYD
jgi:hypothetical protein